jgi:hypothetical protein
VKIFQKMSFFAMDAKSAFANIVSRKISTRNQICVRIVFRPLHLWVLIKTRR